MDKHSVATEKGLEDVILRIQKLHQKDKNFYAFNYDLPHITDEKGKCRYVKQPWYVSNKIDPSTFKQHLVKTTHVRNGEEERSEAYDWGLILPPIHEATNVLSFGSIDVDVYNKRSLLIRIVTQIYKEKLPLVPCYSKSGGLHLYIYSKELISAKVIRSVLSYYNKYLNINAKEIFPKQSELKWIEKKKKYEVGNGILLPYKSCFIESINTRFITDTKMEHNRSLILVTPQNALVKPDMTRGSVFEYLDYAESNLIDGSFFESLPYELPKEKVEKKETKKEEKIEEVKIDFSEPNARPLSEKSPLLKIIYKIKNRKEHARGGTFDNHIVDFVYGAVESKMSDQHILEHLEKVKEYSDKANDDDYFLEKIKNCREKYDKENPGPIRQEIMGDTIYNLKTKKYFNKKTKKSYEKEPYDVKFAHHFPKSTPPSTYFKNHPNKQMAEEEVYRPDLHIKDPFVKGADGLYYLNSYIASLIEPIRPTKIKDIKPFLDLVEHIIPNEVERKYFLDWLAFIVQNPWKKIKTIPLIYTHEQRMGKGSIFDTMTDILGETNAIPTDVKGILDKGVTFAEKQLVLVDECKSSGDWGERRNLKNDLKKIGTETRIQQRKLFVDYQTIETQTCILVFTNEPDALQMEKEDERFFVVKNENERKPQKFYQDYHKWRQEKGSSYVYYYLKTRDISKFEPMAPPPKTKAKEEMQQDDGHPLTLALLDMLNEGVYPFTLDTKVIGVTELKTYMSKHAKGNLVRYVNDPKVIKKSLKEMGAVLLGQVYHKATNTKPSLCAIRDHENILKMDKTKVCNELWKPIHQHVTPDEKHEEIATDKFMNENLEERSKVFEQQHLNGKKNGIYNRETCCWSCRAPISESVEGICPECNYAIKCSCGKCACDKPGSRIEKKGAYAR